MNKAPLQLEHYFITDLHITACQDYNLKKDKKYDIKNFHTNIKYFEKKNYPEMRQVQLKLQYKPLKNENMPYEFGINIVGFFKIAPKLPDSELNNLIRFNAPSMLYSAVREIIANVSGRGPWGSFLIPTVSFLPQKIIRTKKRTISSKK